MGVDWVTIHGRTPSQGTADPARWHDVGQVIAARVPHATDTCGPLPIFLNGDVKTLEEAKEAHRLTGCHGGSQSLLESMIALAVGTEAGFKLPISKTYSVVTASTPQIEGSTVHGRNRKLLYTTRALVITKDSRW